METSEMKTRLDMICNIPESQPLHCDTGHGRNDTVRTFIEIDFEMNLLLIRIHFLFYNSCMKVTSIKESRNHFTSLL